MKKNILIISTAILFTLMWLTPAWSVDQARSGSSMSMPCPKMEQGMGGGMMGGKGMMQGKGMGMMHGKGMMGGRGMMRGKGPGMMQGKGMMGGCPHCPMGRGMGMGMGGGLIREFHQWMKQFMAHRALFDLNSEQMDQLDEIIMGHLKNAVQIKADIRVQMVDLRQMIRQTPMELSAVENQLDQIADLQAGFRMEGIRLYSDLLNMLTDQQKDKVDEIIGSPFPAPWEKMFPMSDDSDHEGMKMESPHEGHQPGESGSGMESEPQDGMEMDKETDAST